MSVTLARAVSEAAFVHHVGVYGTTSIYRPLALDESVMSYQRSSSVIVQEISGAVSLKQPVPVEIIFHK